MDKNSDVIRAVHFVDNRRSDKDIQDIFDEHIEACIVNYAAKQLELSQCTSVYTRRGLGSLMSNNPYVDTEYSLRKTRDEF